VGQAGSSGTDQPVSIGHQQQQQQQQARLTATGDEETSLEQAVSDTLDLRGLVHACLCGIAKGCQITLSAGRLVKSELETGAWHMTLLPCGMLIDVVSAVLPPGVICIPCQACQLRML
jgi:hypothetical protein